MLAKTEHNCLAGIFIIYYCEIMTKNYDNFANDKKKKTMKPKIEIKILVITTNY